MPQHHIIRSAITSLIALGACVNTQAQRCGCPDWPPYEGEHFLCKPVRLSNGARVYRRIGRDSSWLIFRSPSGRRRTLDVHELPDLTGRIGSSFAFENAKTFTLRRRVISGCCAPEEYSLHDKQTGRLIRDFGPSIWLSGNPRYNFVVQFADTSVNSLLLHFIDTNFAVRLPLSKGWTSSSGRRGLDDPYLAFFNAAIFGRVFSICYTYERSGGGAKQTDTLRYRLP